MLELFKIGDLVRHTKNMRLAIVMSNTYPLHGANVCKVIWSDTHYGNIMDVRMLERAYG